MLKKWGLGLVLAASCLVAGIGVSIVWLRLRPSSDMGFSAVADALGALFVGTFTGLIVGVVLAVHLRDRLTVARTSVAAVGAALLVVLAAQIPQRERPRPDPIAPFEPTFVVQAFSRIAPGEPGPPAGLDGYPYREVRVAASDRRLSVKGFGAPTERYYCSGLLNEGELQEFANLARRLIAEDYTQCTQSRSDGGVFSVSVEYIPKEAPEPAQESSQSPAAVERQRNGHASFTLPCLMELDGYPEFVERVQQVEQRLARSNDCD